MNSRDLLVAVYLAIHPGATTVELSQRLQISRSQAFSALKELRNCALITEREVIRPNLFEFLVHGIRYVFPARPGETTLGVPTGIAAPLFPSELAMAVPFVWPSSSGDVRGPSIAPLWRTVPAIVKDDERLHRFLAALDAMRCGRARDREFALDHLKTELGSV
jgi:hypothetical protein